MADISALTAFQGCIPGSCQQVAHIIQGGFRFGFCETAAGLIAILTTIVLHELRQGSAMRVGELDIFQSIDPRARPAPARDRVKRCP